MNTSEVIKKVQNLIRDASVMDIIAEMQTFVDEHELRAHWEYVYSIATNYGGTASSTASTLTDTSASFAIDGSLIGQTINNATDGSSGTITAVTATTITAILSGGTNNTWTSGDAYTIQLTNNIRLPKKIHYVKSIWHGTAFIPLSISYDGYKNTGTGANDPYSENNNIASPSNQSGVILSDYILMLNDDLSATDALDILCEYKLDNEILPDALTTTLSLPDKMLLPMSYFVISRLFEYADYENEYMSQKYERRYKYAYSKVQLNVNMQQNSKLDLGKSGGKYSWQHRSIL